MAACPCLCTRTLLAHQCLQGKSSLRIQCACILNQRCTTRTPIIHRIKHTLCLHLQRIACTTACITGLIMWVRQTTFHLVGQILNNRQKHGTSLLPEKCSNLVPLLQKEWEDLRDIRVTSQKVFMMSRSMEVSPFILTTTIQSTIQHGIGHHLLCPVLEPTAATKRARAAAPTTAGTAAWEADAAIRAEMIVRC